MAQKARPGIHEHGPLEYGFRARGFTAPRNDRSASSFVIREEAGPPIKLFAREVLPRLKEVVHHRD
jgi:hypothetical protein